MAATGVNIKNSVAQAMKIIADQRIEGIKRDKTITAIIYKKVSNKEYLVTYNGNHFSAFVENENSYIPNTAVYVLIPDGNFDNRKKITGAVAYTFNQDKLEYAGSALEQYSIIGNNLLIQKNAFNKNDLDNNSKWSNRLIEAPNNPFSLNPERPLSSDSEYQECNILYSDNPEDIYIIKNEQKQKKEWYTIRQSTVDAYIKNAKAFMLKADFKTSLFKKHIQEAVGEYGLILTVKVANKGFIYKTIQDAWDELSPYATYLTYDTTGNPSEVIKLETYKTNIENVFNNVVEVSALKENLISKIDELDIFISGQPNSWNENTKILVQTYSEMLHELCEYDFDEHNNELTFQDYKNLYFNWFEQKPADITTELTYEYIFNSNYMVGNPYQFTDWLSQYMIYEINPETFVSFSGLYFYCKNFNPVTANGEIDDFGKSIYVKNIQLFLLEEADEEQGDYKLALNYPNGASFTGLEDTNILSVKAEVIYQKYEDITTQCNIMWFKYDPHITTDDTNYNSMAGPSWRKISGSTYSAINNVQQFYSSDNNAYENKYLCLAVLNIETVLRKEFTLFNELKYHNFKIISDSGTNFAYNVNLVKTLTCLVDGESNLDYIYEWSVTYNNTSILLTQEHINKLINITNSETATQSEKNAAARTLQVIKGIEIDETNKNVLYFPSSLMILNQGAVVSCEIKEDDNISLGVADITLTLDEIPVLKGYYINIKNADQVFQYSESGIAPTSERYEEPYELQSLECTFFAPNGEIVDDNLYTVKWQWPINDTLLLIDTTLAQKNPNTDRYDLYIQKTCPLQIKEEYDYTASDNQIICFVEYAGATYSQTTNFTFAKVGDNGTNGTDIVAKISPIIDNISSNILNTEPLTLQVFFTKENNNEKKYTYKWNIGTYLNDTPSLKLDLYRRNELVSKDEYKNVKWSIAGPAVSSKMTVYRGDFDNKYEEAVISYDETLDKPEYNYIIKAQAGLVKDKEQLDDIQYYNVFYPIPIIKKLVNNTTSLPYTIGIDKKLTLRQVLYNSEGDNPQYNKNQGVKLLFNIINKENFSPRKIWWKTYGGLTTEQDTPSLQIVNKEKNIVSSYITNYKLEDSQSDIENLIELRNTYQDLYNDGINFSILDNEKINKPFEIPVSFDSNLLNKYQLDITTWQNLINPILSNNENAYHEEDDNETYIVDNYDINDIDNNTFIDDENVTDITLLEEEFISFENIKTYWNSLTSDDVKDILIQLYQDIYRENLQLIINYYQDLIDHSGAEYGDFINILPKDNYSGLSCNNIVKAIIYREEVNAQNQLTRTNEYEIIIPVHLSLNTYGLAALNGWDGNSVEVEEDKKYILAPMIGAGKKEDDNKFTGITMGVEKTYGEKKETKVGIFGHSHGQRSIFLDAETGSATFGLPEDEALDAANPLIEGQIQLVPGGTSKISQWNFDSRSLYRVVSKQETDYILKQSNNRIYDTQNFNANNQFKKLAQPYKQRTVAVSPTLTVTSVAAPKHAHGSIPHDQQGILLSANPTYISVKGRPLLENIDKDIKWEDSNTEIQNGDTFEVEIDPNNYSLFTIYTHKKHINEDNTEVWYRIPKAGIDGSGRFYSNAMKEGGTVHIMGNLGGFGVNASGERKVEDGITSTPPKLLPYFGASYDFEDNSGTLVKFFTYPKDPDSDTTRKRSKTSPLFISTSGNMGKWNKVNDEWIPTSGDEGLRPIGIYSGNYLHLYSGTNVNFEQPTSDITTLQLNDEDKNILLSTTKTRGTIKPTITAISDVKTTELFLQYYKSEVPSHLYNYGNWNTIITGDLNQTIGAAATYNFNSNVTNNITGTITATITGAATYNYKSGITISNNTTTVVDTDATSDIYISNNQNKTNGQITIKTTSIGAATNNTTVTQVAKLVLNSNTTKKDSSATLTTDKDITLQLDNDDTSHKPIYLHLNQNQNTTKGTWKLSGYYQDTDSAFNNYYIDGDNAEIKIYHPKQVEVSAGNIVLDPASTKDELDDNDGRVFVDGHLKVDKQIWGSGEHVTKTIDNKPPTPESETDNPIDTLGGYGSVGAGETVTFSALQVLINKYGRPTFDTENLTITIPEDKSEDIATLQSKVQELETAISKLQNHHHQVNYTKGNAVTNIDNKTVESFIQTLEAPNSGGYNILTSGVQYESVPNE